MNGADLNAERSMKGPERGFGGRRRSTVYIRTSALNRKVFKSNGRLTANWNPSRKISMKPRIRIVHWKLLRGRINETTVAGFKQSDSDVPHSFNQVADNDWV